MESDCDNGEKDNDKGKAIHYPLSAWPNGRISLIVFKIVFLVILFLKMVDRGPNKKFLPGGIFFINVFLVCFMMTSSPSKWPEMGH